MLNTGATRVPTHYTIPVGSHPAPKSGVRGERIIPIETTRSSYPQARV
jgi:hypothetical protein